MSREPFVDPEDSQESAAGAGKLSRKAYDKELAREKVVLPKRQKTGDYRESEHPVRYVEEHLQAAGLPPGI